MTEIEQYPETALKVIQYKSRGKKLIIFNGPPSSGKDEACKYIVKTSNRNVKHIMFKQKLVQLTQFIFGVTNEWWEPRYTEEGKNVKREELNGFSQREALIFVSETVIKPTLGNDYFGKATVKDIVTFLSEVDASVVSDCGFIEEIDVINNEPSIDKEDVLIVRCHRDGYDFSGDSRSYVDAESYGFDVVDLWNDGDLDRYHDKLGYCFPELLSEPVDWGMMGTPLYQAEATCSFEDYVKWFGVNGITRQFESFWCPCGEGDEVSTREPLFDTTPIELGITRKEFYDECMQINEDEEKAWHEWHEWHEQYLEYMLHQSKNNGKISEE